MNTQVLMAELVERDGRYCRWPGCRTFEVQVHHIIPECFGGKTVPSNTCLMCDWHHTELHRWIQMPDPQQLKKIRPEYAAAWTAMWSMLQLGPDVLFTGLYDNKPAVNGSRPKETN